MENHFCSSTDTKCQMHPTNHNKGCDPCIIDNLERKKMPACFFIAVSDDVSGVTDYSMKGFVDFFLKKQNESKNC